MTGIFTYRNFSLRETPALDGQVAVVTGGQAGIGQEITAQLLLHGIEKAIIVSRSPDKFNTAREEWRRRDGISLGEHDARVDFVQCDLADIASVHAAAERIKQRTDRIHIMICNAGLGVPYEYKRSPQKIDRVFATNCVGHQVLVTRLLPLMKNSVSTAPNGPRIAIASSSLHLVCRQLDLGLLTSPSRIKWPALYDGVWRYSRSNVGNILFAKELSRRLLQDPDPASRRIYVNSFFPGNIVTDQWHAWSSYFGTLVGSLMRSVGGYLGQTVEDGAATALYLAASEEVRAKNLRGRYFVPIAESCDPSPVAQDVESGRALWDWVDDRVAETMGPKWKE